MPFSSSPTLSLFSVSVLRAFLGERVTVCLFWFSAAQHEADNIRKQYVKPLDAYCCLGVLRVKLSDTGSRYDQFYINFVLKLSCAGFGFGLCLILVTGCELVGRIQNSEIYRVTAVTPVRLNKLAVDDSQSDVRRLLGSGTFYFSKSTDGSCKAIELTQSMQSQQAAGMPDDKFLW